MRWMMYSWWCEGGGDRAWWVIETVFLRSPNKGFRAYLGDLPPDMSRRQETWVSLCNLMLKLCISRSSTVLGSDRPSPQSNKRKGNYIHPQWVTLMSATRHCRLFKATMAYISACTDARAALAPQLSRGLRLHHWQSAEDYGQIEEAAASLGWFL